MLLATIATVAAFAVSFFVVFANENMAAPDGNFRGGSIIALVCIVTAGLWLSCFLS